MTAFVAHVTTASCSGNFISAPRVYIRTIVAHKATTHENEQNVRG